MLLDPIPYPCIGNYTCYSPKVSGSLSSFLESVTISYTPTELAKQIKHFELFGMGARTSDVFSSIKPINNYSPLVAGGLWEVCTYDYGYNDDGDEYCARHLGRNEISQPLPLTEQI